MVLTAEMMAGITFIIQNGLMDEKILSLLNCNLRVIIPDFGAFIIRQQEPRIVVFNEMLKSNDGLLLEYIIRKESVEPEIALQLLTDYTSQALKILESGKAFTIEGLGDLKKDSRGRIMFFQIGQELLPETESAAPVKTETAIPRSFSVNEDPVKPNYESRPVVFRKKALSNQAIKWMVMFVAANLIVVLFFVFRGNSSKQKPKSTQQAAFSQSVLDQLSDSVISAASDTTLIYSGGQSQKISSASADPENIRFYIVAGCFRDEVNADELVDSLKSMGYRAEKFGMIGDLYAVSFASFDNKDLAVNELARIRKEHHPDAWMTRF